jgi:hypothetical protein
MGQSFGTEFECAIKEAFVLTEAGILMEDGTTITEGKVLEIVKEARQFLQKGDIAGFRYLLIGDGYDPEIEDSGLGEKVKELSSEECKLLLNTVIAEKGATVSRVLSRISYDEAAKNHKQ